MTAKHQDITIEQGADFDLELDIPDSIDATDLQAAMEFRAFYGDPTSFLTLTTENGGLAVNTLTRKLKIVIAAGISADLLPGDYVHDIKSKEAGGKISRLYQGIATVSAQVTLFDFDEDAAVLLLESGGFLLLEDGSHLLLENGTYEPPGFLLEGGGFLLLESGGRFLLDT